MREMADVAGSSPKTVFKTSAQVGKTTVIENLLGYKIHLAPCPILFINPTLEMSETFSKDRFDPMVRDTAVLTELVNQRSRESGSTILHKKFKGGHLSFAGSNSPASLASRPSCGLVGDEVSRFAQSAGAEGNPLAIGERRLARFWNSFELLASTPTNEGSCQIDYYWQYSDQRKFFVACPHCGQEQVLIFGQLKWEEGNPKNAWYECEQCHGAIDETLKPTFLAAGKWRATNPAGEYPGFHIWEAYVPTTPWHKIARDFVQAKRGGAERLRVFVNTVLGEVWKADAGTVLEWQTLKARAEPYQPMTVPMGGLLLVAGVDTQDNRLAVTVWAFGRGEECWAIYSTEIYGDPELPQVWEGLIMLLDSTFTHAGGAELKIVACAIDTAGHKTQAVYNFVRKYPERRIYAIRGATTKTAPIIGAPSYVEVTYNGRTYKRGVKLWTVGTHTIKSTIYSRLRLAEPGPGYVHFPIGLDDEFYEQLCAEKLQSSYKKGFEVKDWVKTRARNEVLDTLVYAYAVGQALGLQRYNWARLEQEILPKQEQPEPAPEDDEGEDLVGATPGRSTARASRRRGAGAKRNFATNW